MFYYRSTVIEPENGHESGFNLKRLSQNAFISPFFPNQKGFYKD